MTKVTVFKSLFAAALIVSTIQAEAQNQRPTPNARPGRIAQPDSIDEGRFSPRWKNAENYDSEDPGDVTLGDAIITGGEGCPDGSVSATLSPDSKQLSLLYDSWSAEAGDRVGAREVRKECKMVVPVFLEGSYRFAVVKVDYRGYNLIPFGGTSTFKTSYRFINPRTGSDTYLNRRVERQFTFNGPLDEDFFLNSDAAPLWSPCASTFNFEITTTMHLNSPNGEDMSMIIDSTDVQAPIFGSPIDPAHPTYHLLWRSCSLPEPMPRRRAVRH